MTQPHRVVITGMSINTLLGDRLDVYLSNLLEGKSGLVRWKKHDTSKIYCKVGGDLSGYDYVKKAQSFEGRIPSEIYRRLKKFINKAPWSTKLTALLALDAYLDAGLLNEDVSLDARPKSDRIATIVTGHNINLDYLYQNRTQFDEEPDYIDSMFSLHGLDTDHAGTISELLQAKGAAYTMGGACASGNIGLRNAITEIRYHGADLALVVGSVFDYSPMDLHGMCLMGAISFQKFNEEPTRASRPFDTLREGFVPSHGGAVLVVESLESAQKRGARIYAEVLGVEANSDGNHLPQPSEEGQSRLMIKLLEQTGVRRDEIDFICAHATSTPLGDLTEVRSIKRVFGEHAKKLKINAPKSILDHTCWSAPVVETVASVLQMNAGRLHPSINIDQLDPEVDLDVCANQSVRHDVRLLLKNSFGFGGINSVSVLKRWDA